jgi:parvulin-like peptidyl-prolyl isomerase
MFGSFVLLAVLELARVNGEVITDAQLKAAFVGKHGGHTVFLGGDTETRRFLNIVINERLLVQEAYTLGLDEDPAVKPLVDEFRDKTAIDHLLKIEIEEASTPTADEIQAAWERSTDLFLAREIVAGTRDDAESIRVALLQGADFEATARACSITPSRTRGGNLAPFTWGSLSSEVESAAFALQPGEISPVFRTKDGWCVLLLVDRVDAVRPALDERISARIAAKLKERKIAARTDELSVRLWKKFDAQIALDEMRPHALMRMLATAPDTVVATWNGGDLKLQDAFTANELKMFAADKVRDTLRAAINTALIRLEAKERKIADVESVAEVVDRYEARLMESVLYSKHVLDDVKVGDDEVRASYESQKASLTLPEKRRVAHIAVATEAEAKKIFEQVTKGRVEFSELLQQSLDKPSVKNGGDLGWIEKGNVLEKYDPLFALPVNGIAKPIQSDKSWHIVRVTDIAPAHPLSFEEAREKIRATLLEKKKHDARERWIEKLREAGEIEILEAGVKEFVKANPYQDPNQ